MQYDISTPPWQKAAPSALPAPTQGTANARTALDNLIRRELRVSDPGDPGQIASALLQRYQSDPRAQAIRQEAQGLPFLAGPVSVCQPATVPTPTGLDLDQATSDINADLEVLKTNNQLKDLVPELEGWEMGIRAIIADGLAAAPYGIDTQQRDKVFAARRQLGDYARLARLVGVFSPTVQDDYRSLAQSLDEMAAVLLVMLGESIANTGIAGGRYLLQVPFTDLQARREAVLATLRNLVGSTQEAFGPNDWPRGLDAYRLLMEKLEREGQGDLRSLLVEREMERALDLLIDRARHGVQGLRALGATAVVDMQRFSRLITMVADMQRSVGSPPLAAFWDALHLFVDGFKPAGGMRLLRIARPAILSYGLYGLTSMSNSERTLLNLVDWRGTLASYLDDIADFDDWEFIDAQIVFDKVLYDLDRAIDLYSVAEHDGDIREARATAVYYEAAAISAYVKNMAGAPSATAAAKKARQSTAAQPRSNEYLLNLVKEIQTRTLDKHDHLHRQAIIDELNMHLHVEQQITPVVQQMAQEAEMARNRLNRNSEHFTVFKMISAAIKTLQEQGPAQAFHDPQPHHPHIPANYEYSLGQIADKYLAKPE